MNNRIAADLRLVPALAVADNWDQGKSSTSRNRRWDGPERKAGQVSSELALGGLIAGAPDKLLWEDIEPAARKIEFADRGTACSYDVLEKIAHRVILGGGRVISVRATDLPTNAQLAVILRYAV